VSFTNRPPDPTTVVAAQTRAHGEPCEATFSDGTVHFARPQPRVARGQVVALYAGDVLLGGGIAC
jgi:tRNA U34 2-thiouridine synthase MnmA/TrmU